VRAAIDGFLDSPDVRANPNTLRAYTSVLDRIGEEIGTRRRADRTVGQREAGDLEPQPRCGRLLAGLVRRRAALGRASAPGSGEAAPGEQRQHESRVPVADRPALPPPGRAAAGEDAVAAALRIRQHRASAVLALNVEDLDLPNKQARITAKGGDTMWITWGTDTAHLLPRLTAGRERGPLFLSEYRPGPHRLATTDPRDICPETGRARLGYDRARILLARYADGLRLHQLRHSSATHLGEANVSASVIMAKTGHKSLRSVQRYVKPGLAAVHAATETLSSPRRRG
jgi:integrase